MTKPIQGFSKLTKEEKIDWIVSNYTHDAESAKIILKRYWNADSNLQKLHDEFIENTITNYYLPLGIAPNFLINDKLYAIPMAIEESSVIAAASKSAKFWFDRGGFKTTILGTEKVGQVHFTYDGDSEDLATYVNHQIKKKFFEDVKEITKNMERRGGGILDIVLKDKTDVLENYYQLHVTFETLDAMGANFINSCLEQFAKTLKREADSNLEHNLNIVMSILSNFVPNCLVRAEVSCPVEKLTDDAHAEAFAKKMIQAIAIAKVEPYRAVTHNKGIMNGVDAVILATGNDFRAIEAGIHAYAAKDGRYTSLTDASIENGIFSRYRWRLDKLTPSS